MKITNEIHRFREASRHLWNTYLKRGADHYSHDTFIEICKMLFEEQIIRRLNLDVPVIPIEVGRTILQMYRIFADHRGKLNLFVNRDIPASGYWDYPVSWIPPEENPEISPMCFYDFDNYGWCRLEYYRVRIVDCHSHPEIIGRDALIDCHSVEIEVLEEKVEGKIA